MPLGFSISWKLFFGLRLVRVGVFAFILCLGAISLVFSQSNDSTLVTSVKVLGSAQSSLIIERIEILGATKTKPNVIHRYLSLKTGDAVTPEAIDRDYQALTATHFFKQVEFSSKPGSAPGHVILVIEVIERRWPWLEFAGGFSELEGWYIVPAGVRFDNTFGNGNIAGGRFIIGDRTGGFYLHFRQPQIFSSSFDLQLEAGSNATDFIHYLSAREAVHRVDIGSGRIALAGNRGLARYFSAGFRFNVTRPEGQYKIGDTTRTDFPPELAGQLAKKRVNSFFTRLQIDTRDQIYFPHAGVWGALSLEAANVSTASSPSSSTFERSGDFRRFVFDVRLYQSIGANVFAVRAKTGLVSRAAPFYERFYLGGAYSLRGFAERGMTPLGWGTELLLAQAEMRFPVAGDSQQPSLMAALFFDAGRIESADVPNKQNRFFTAAGAGFRVKVPIIGLLRCDFAYPLDRDDFRFHFALGQTF